MKWTYEPGELFSVMAFTQNEVKILVQILSGKVQLSLIEYFLLETQAK